MQILTDVITRSPAASSLSRRSFLQAMGLAFACRLRPIASGFTAITDDLVWLMRWCCFGGELRPASVG